MNGLAGELALCAAVLTSAWAAASAGIGWRLGDGRWVERARKAMFFHLVALLGASGVLLWALVRGDFRFTYIYAHTDVSLSVLYRISAFWSGQEGSLLLWALILAAMASVRAAQRKGGAGEPVTLGVLALLELFFAGLLLFGASPFGMGHAHAAGPMDGAGLNPMLQHWAMAIHPPMLFLGYAASALPLAIMIGRLVGAREGGAGADGNAWIAAMRRWAIFGWTSLTLGIVLGAWWAYVELGWGGYWAWDPVENASLLPWLTGAALLHAMAAHRRFGSFKWWSAWLSLGTCALCVLGTALTRSGFVESVHAFARSGIGVAFLGLLIGVVAAGVAVMVRKRAALAGDGHEAKLVSPEGMLIAGLVLLVSMAGVTLAGTVAPLVTGSVLDTPVSVGAAFYNRAVLPLAIGLGAVLAAAPLLAGPARGRRAMCAGVGAVLGLLLSVMRGWVAMEFLACAAIAGAVVFGIVGSAAREWWLGRANGWGRAAAAVFVGVHARRSGAWMAHVGLALLMIGVGGSGLFGDRHVLRLGAGETRAVGSYHVTLTSLESVREAGFSAAEATVLVRDARGREWTLRAQQRFYDRFPEPNTEVAVRAGLGEDVYVALVGWTVGGAEASLQVLVNPLTAWVWIGAGAMALGGAWAMAAGLVTARAAAPKEIKVSTGARAAHG